MNLFSSVAGKRTPKSKFNLSHERKMAIGLGDLVPTFHQEILPGDKIRLNQEIMARMTPMIAPIMHQIDVWTHYFYVPNRLIWDGWENFITGGTDGLQKPLVPYVILNEANKSYFTESTMLDFLGYPIIDETKAVAGATNFSSLPLRANALIYNEYFRDQTIQAEIPINKESDGDDSANLGLLYLIAQRKWAKDYFTSAMPWTQRGPQSLLAAEINYSQPARAYGDDDNVAPVGDLTVGANGGIVGSSGPSNGPGGARIENIDDLGISVNSLRQSVRLQEWLERQARGGARLTETVLSHFGVKSRDSRLQRPEFLGASKNPLSVSEVLNTAGIADADTNTGGPVGDMAGHGVAVGMNKGFNKRFDEHGYVIGYTSIVPKRNYQQMAPRCLKRFDKFDYYWPEFANLGEQAILKEELFFDQNDTAKNKETFGYTPMYSEYKFNFNTVHGAFRSSLNHWHLGEIFETQPILTGSFLNCRPSDRIYAFNEQRDYLKAGEEVYLSVYNKVDAVRPMPYYGTPRL